MKKLPIKILMLAVSIISLGVLLLLLVLSKENKPKTSTMIPTPTVVIPKTIPIKKTEITNLKNYVVQFNIENTPLIPPTIEIITTQKPFTTNQALSLTKKLNIEGQPISSGNSVFWSSKESTLQINPTSGYIRYKKRTSPTTTIVSLKEAENMAYEFLIKTGVFTPTKGTAISTTYNDRSDEFPKETKEITEDGFYEISYLQAIHNYPIYQQLGNPGKAIVLVSPGGEVFDAELFKINPTIATDTSTIPLAQAQNMIKDNEGTIVHLGDQTFEKTSITNMLISNVKLAYLDAKTENTLFPIFVFEGEATTPFGKKPVILYLKAY